MSKQEKLELFIVFLISLPVAIFSNIVYIVGFLETPKDMMYLGVTHHWQDFFVYTSQVAQGQQGAWVTGDLYTIEYTAPTLLYWVNNLLGHIAALLNANPIAVFNISVYPLTVTMLLSVYILFKRVFPDKKHALLAVFFFVFSTSVLNKLPQTAETPYYPFILWGTPHLLMDRFSTLPHHIVQILLVVLMLILLFQQANRLRAVRYVILCIATALLTLLQPIMTAMIVGIACCVLLVRFKWKHIDTMIFSSIGFLVPFIYMLLAFQGEPYIQLRLWERTQHTYTTLPFLLLSIGPILLFALVGVLGKIKKLAPIEIFGLLLVGIGYGLFLQPAFMMRIGITNVRVVFPAMLFFFAWFAAVGVDMGASWMAKKHPQRKALMGAILFSLFLLAVAPTIMWEVSDKTQSQLRLGSPIYVAISTADAFSYLKSLYPPRVVVLGNTETNIDVIIPALTGHTTVTGHPLITINSEEKRATVKAFFERDMRPDVAKRFLARERVTYVLFTTLDGDHTAFTASYPFLNPVFATDTAWVYTIAPNNE